MKAIMSEKLRSILSHPQDARELQKQLSASSFSHKSSTQGKTSEKDSVSLRANDKQ